MTDESKVWGIKLCGHDFDLQDWRETLREPFDPAVVQQGDEFILRVSEFQSGDSAPAVLDKAIALFEVLNGAMRAAKGSDVLAMCGPLCYCSAAQPLCVPPAKDLFFF